MIIHVVQPGDTIDTIADQYGVTAAKLIKDNELPSPNQLVIGETLVIVYPSETHIVQAGDTLDTIASMYNISVNELLRNNPFLSDAEYIYPGEELVISYNRTGSVTTHGYSTTFIDRNTLRKSLPYLTYLTVFNYRTAKNGEVLPTSDDTDILQMTKDYGVLPLMLMTTLSVQGDVDLELTYEVLINEEVQNRLFDNVLNIVREKGYYGVNISAQYITSANQALFNNYTRKLSNRLSQEGYVTMITLNPRVELVNNEVQYDNIDYTEIGESVELALFLQYKWGTSFGPPSPVSSVYSMDVFLDYALTQIPPEKIYVGVPILGYDWELPFITGYSKASSLTIESVMILARDVGAVIEYDELSQTPYFRYDNIVDRAQHEVWFVNAITINSLIKMLLENGITGTGIWNILQFYAQLWLVINSQYTIQKYLPEF